MLKKRVGVLKILAKSPPMRTKPRLADVSGGVTKLSVNLMNVTSQEQCPLKTPLMGAECKKDRRNQTRKNPVRNPPLKRSHENQDCNWLRRIRGSRCCIR